MRTLKLIVLLFCLVWNTHAQESNPLIAILQSMHKEKDPEKNVAMMQQAIMKLKLDPIRNAEDIDLLKGQVAMSYVSARQFSKFEKYIEQISNKFNQTSYLNMASELLQQHPKLLAYAEKVARQTVVLYESYKDDPSARPTTFPLDDWNRFMKMAAYPYYQSYAAILFKTGKYKAALNYQEKAIVNQDLEKLPPQIVANYAALLEIDGQLEKASHILLTVAKTTQASEPVKAQLKRLLLKLGQDESSADKLIDHVQANVEQTYRTELAKKMIDSQAPDFNLPDLNGRRVSLHDFRGKIVVLDFWATWCAPCIAAMPTMEKLSKQHPEVVFLFIATQETATDAKQQIHTFLRNKKLNIKVLIDQLDTTTSKIFTAAKSYQISGIPAKIVIDQTGRLRFKAQGFSSEEELKQELNAMISLVNDPKK